MPKYSLGGNVQGVGFDQTLLVFFYVLVLKQISTVSLASIWLRCSGGNSVGVGGCKFRAGAGAVRELAGGGQGVFSGQRWTRVESLGLGQILSREKSLGHTRSAV